MKITNRLNLPEALVKAVQNDPYTKGESDFSVTELIAPARQRQLQRQFADKLEEDVVDRLWSLYGQIAHVILERANELAIAEKRFSMTLDGFKISGQVDSLCLTNGVLSDYKFTALYPFKVGTPKAEWIAQLNMQLEILRQNGLDAKELNIVGLLRDWRVGESAREKKYPDPVVRMKIPMWSREETIEYMRSRVKAHSEAKESLPLCPTEDLWGGKRCENYCSVSKFCSQYLLKKSEGEKESA